MNPNDEVRHKILKYFYDRNAQATSRTGKKGSAVKISDAKRELKALYGLTQQQVMSNLTYLIDRGWVKTFDVEKTVQVRGGTVPSTVTWYEIAADGIDHWESESAFKQTNRFAGVNILASGQSVITLGDGNVVNVRYQQLHQALTSLKKELIASDRLSDEQKLNVVADVESLNDQLAKREPVAGIVRQLWRGIEGVATAAGFADAVTRIAPLIAAL